MPPAADVSVFVSDPEVLTDLVEWRAVAHVAEPCVIRAVTISLFRPPPSSASTVLALAGIGSHTVVSLTRI